MANGAIGLYFGHLEASKRSYFIAYLAIASFSLTLWITLSIWAWWTNRFSVGEVYVMRRPRVRSDRQVFGANNNHKASDEQPLQAGAEQQNQLRSAMAGARRAERSHNNVRIWVEDQGISQVPSKPDSLEVAAQVGPTTATEQV